ncbi:MAG: agmatine deiminase family protein [Verrucomicrobiales bacterium]|nr:agmatine deiminase family protein [Verrucomicrobiales bacterium]
MKSRRQFLASGAPLYLLPQMSFASEGFFMPEEGAPHTRTWMAFGADRSIWGKRLLPEVQRSLALIANTISDFEPVTMLVRPHEMALARNFLSDSISLLETKLDDFWIRDTGPTFLINESGGKAAIDFNFNGWGKKQTHRHDREVAGFIAAAAGVTRIKTDLVMEGGCIEVDGEGTAIITESCVLNENRNPGMSKAEFEETLMPLLGINKVIWLPGVRGKDITDGHTDFYARFVHPGVVIAGYEPNPKYGDHEITKQQIAMLREATDAHGKKLEVEALTAPEWVRPKYESSDFAAGYIGYYVCNGAVIAQEFGDEKADTRATTKLQQLFPDREIIMLNVDGIAAGGGSIHCATQQEPRPIST